MRRALIVLVAAGMFLAACGAPTDDAEPAGGQPTDTTEAPDRSEPAREATTPPESAPPLESDAVVGEVPAALLSSVIDEVAKVSAAARQSIDVIRAESVIWPDGSLGCPEPGNVYTQAQVEGFWIVFDAGGEEFDYRTSGADYFRRCIGSRGVGPPTG